jgi:hypothetical protein
MCFALAVALSQILGQMDTERNAALQAKHKKERDQLPNK